MHCTRHIFSIVALAAWISSGFAQVHAGPLLIAQATQPSPAMVSGEVRKIDRGTGKITLKHDPIPNLDMPSMTMVFRVKEPAMLDAVKAGDKVRFSAEKTGGALTVMQIEPAK